ncbi:MAG TPA: invasion associated locus B family protein [Alphaproteobacteria bacterium]|nr:invasion associated locus B family protein [Alphaproteobacteria bacterium]
MVRQNLKFIFVICFCLAMASAKVQASEPTLIGTFGDWRAYSFMENGNKVCYMASQPKTAVGNYTSRGDVFALITHRPAEKTKDVFSYITGYPYKAGSEVTIDVNGSAYKLFTQDDTAWAADAAADAALAGAIQKGSTMVVKGTSSRGTLTTDTYGLSGSSKAYSTISQECGV